METETSLLNTTNTTTIDVENHEYQIEYASHDHPLTLCEIDEDCSICRERCLGRRTYGCNQCGLFLHESCTKIDIPKEIYHDFHPHPLRLAINKKDGNIWEDGCKSCYRLLPTLMFECRDCWFRMDVECALLPTKVKQDGCSIDHIQHFKHPHPLILCDDQKENENNFCFGCEGGLSTRPRFSYDASLLLEGSESIYGCLQCEFFLHERCARLPLEIDSPFHPDHSLELVWSINNPECQGCDRPFVNVFTYQCRGSCKFFLGVECAFLTPIVKLESHNHLLTLFPSINPILRCQICNEKCDSSNIFRCIDCDYNLHLHCGPLPCSIKHICHIDHPLKLMFAFVEDGYVDDTVYCDACEQPRDPDQCVYFCKDCNFFAELKCVEAEVLRSLNGERGNVKLRTANKKRDWVRAKLISNVITNNVETDSDNEMEDIDAKYSEVKLHENFFSGYYTDEEYEQLIEIFNKARVKLLPTKWIPQLSHYAFFQGKTKVSEHIERCKLVVAKLKSQGETSIFCCPSDEEFDNGLNAITGLLSKDFKKLMIRLDSYYNKHELLEVFFRRDYNVVRIGEHEIVEDSASVLKGLLHKHGDFTGKSKLSERLKAIFLTMFCEVIHTMCLTNVREVDQQMLRKWWKSLKLVQHAGFEIQFAIDQLYKVVRASFGMKALTSYSNMKSGVDKISNEIEEQEAKLEEKKRDLEFLKSQVNKWKYGIEYQTSPILKECLQHVSELKWKKAWDG